MQNVTLKGLILLCCLVSGLSCVPWPRPARLPLATYLARTEPLIAEQRYSQAIDLLEQAAEAHAQNPWPLIRIGQVYLAQHHWLMAEDAFNRALARDPHQALASAGLAETLFQQGRLDEAQHYWYETISLDPQLPGVFTGLGRVYLTLLDFDAAREAFLEQQQHRSDAEAQWYLAALTAPTDRTAALDYLKGIPASTGDGQAFNDHLPETSISLAAWRDYLLQTLSLVPAGASQAELAKTTGIALAQVQMWPLAVYALSVAREESGQAVDAETLAFLGHALAQAGRPALELFEQAHEADPAAALPLYFQGLYLRQQGALQAAEQLFQQAIHLEPENPAFYAEMGQTKAQQADLASAEIWYTAAVQVAAGDKAQFQLLLAQFYAEYGYRLNEAGIPMVQAIIEADPDNAAAYSVLGWMQFQASVPPNMGEEALRRALELEPNLAIARYRLARSLEAQGRVGQAMDEYRRVVDLDKSGIYRQRALQDLQRLAPSEKASLFAR